MGQWWTWWFKWWVWVAAGLLLMIFFSEPPRLWFWLVVFGMVIAYGFERSLR